jgi:hypothetical protein
MGSREKTFFEACGVSRRRREAPAALSFFKFQNYHTFSQK